MTAGALGVVLTADNSQLVAKLMETANVTERQAKRMIGDLNAMNAKVKEWSGTQTRAANDAKVGLESTARGMEHVGFQTSAAKRELLVLAHELSQGNYSRFGGSLMVLAERTNAMELAFSAAGLTIGVAVAAVGGFVTAAIAGHLEAEKFAASLITTGNAAGMTADSFNSLSAAAATAAGSTIGKSKETLQDLISTGRMYPEVIGIATQASLNLQRITGQTAEEVAKDFGKMTENVAKWAADYNKHAHFVSAAQFQHIKDLEDAGKKEEAAAETLKLLNGQLAIQAENLGSAERAWRALKDAVSGGIDAMKSVGKQATAGEELSSLRERLARAQSGVAGDRFYGADGQQVASKSAAIASITAQIDKTRELMRTQEKAAAQAASSAAAAEKAITKIMEPKKAVKPEQHDPLESRLDTFRQSELAANERVNEALRTENLKAYEQQRADRLKAEQQALDDEAAQEAALQALLGAHKNKDAIRQANQDMPFGMAAENAVTDYFKNVGDQSERAAALVNGSFSRMNDALVNFAKTGKLSFSDLFGFMAEEFIRNEILMAEKKFLTDGAGNALGFGSIFSSLAGFFQPHANGLDRVPFDNYPAMLHKGERVQTAIQAASSSANGGAQIVNITNGPLTVGDGVSRGEVAAALKQQQASTVEIIRRKQATGRWA